jgi:hypothetical protein
MFVPERFDKDLICRRRRRQLGISRYRQTLIQPLKVPGELPISQAAGQNNIGLSFPANDAVCNSSYCSFQPHTAEFCFIDRVDEKPRAFLRSAPKGQPRSICCAQSAVEPVPIDILYRRKKRELPSHCALARLFPHLLCFAAPSFSQDDHTASR